MRKIQSERFYPAAHDRSYPAVTFTGGAYPAVTFAGFQVSVLWDLKFGAPTRHSSSLSTSPPCSGYRADWGPATTSGKCMAGVPGVFWRLLAVLWGPTTHNPALV